MGIRRNSIFGNINIFKAQFSLDNTVNIFSFWQLSGYFLRGIIIGFEAMGILNVWRVDDYINFAKQL